MYRCLCQAGKPDLHEWPPIPRKCLLFPLRLGVFARGFLFARKDAKTQRRKWGAGRREDVRLAHCPSSFYEKNLCVLCGLARTPSARSASLREKFRKGGKRDLHEWPPIPRKCLLFPLRLGVFARGFFCAQRREDAKNGLGKRELSDIPAVRHSSGGATIPGSIAPKADRRG